MTWSSDAKQWKALDFLVERDNLRQCKWVPAAEPDLHSGQVLLEVVNFAFTANNVTYAVAGDMMSYWNFFPAEPGWGRIPVWGFGHVIRSSHEGVAEGERALARALQSDNLTAIGTCRVHLCVIHLFTRDSKAMAEHASAAIDVAARSGDHIVAYTANGFLAWAESRLGRHDEAAAAMARSKEILGDPGLFPFFLQLDHFLPRRQRRNESRL